MKDDINKWENSDKHKMLMFLLKEKREKLIEELLLLKFKIRTMANKEELLTRKELEEFVDSILEISEEESDVEWIQTVLAADMNEDEIYLQFIKTIINWFFYLQLYQANDTSEDYLLCAKIMKVIKMEADEVEKILQIKFGKNKQYRECIDEILENYRQQINKDED